MTGRIWRYLNNIILTCFSCAPLFPTSNISADQWTSLLCPGPGNCDCEQLGPCVTELKPLLSLALHQALIQQKTEVVVLSDS